MKSKIDYDWYFRSAEAQDSMDEQDKRNLFCLDHWWKDVPEEEWDVNAACYELLRRHPSVGIERAKHDYNIRDLETAWMLNRSHGRYSGPRLLEILISLSPSTWQGLQIDEQNEFVSTLRRTDLGKYMPRPIGKPVIACARTPTKADCYQIHISARKFADEIQMFSKVPEQYIPPVTFSGNNAFSELYAALRQGKLVLSLDVKNDHDPDSTLESIRAIYLKDFAKLGITRRKRKSHSVKWLKTIQMYEESELKRPKNIVGRKANQSKRLRFQRLFDGLDLFKAEVII